MIKEYLTYFLREMDKIKDDDIRRFFTIMYLNFCWGKIENDYSLLYRERVPTLIVYEIFFSKLPNWSLYIDTSDIYSTISPVPISRRFNFIRVSKNGEKDE